MHHLSLRALSCAAATLGLLAAVAPAQTSRNVTLLSVAKPSTVSSFNDVWGYTSPRTGKEYGILMSTQGTHIYEISNPRSPVLRGTIPSEVASSSRNLWRDGKTYGEYLYVVSEAHGGMQIIDLRNPDSPRKVGVFGASLWTNAHNIAMDVEQGIAYVCGTRNGMHIIDVRTNPTSPRRLRVYTTRYIHDLSIAGGFAYLADQNTPALRIHDASNVGASFPLLSTIRTPGARVSHNTWPSRDGNVCMTTNETGGGPVGVFDVSNKRAPRLVATWHPFASNVLPHNVLVRERVGHLSYYSEGYQALDISNPASPQRVGWYDTTPATSGGSGAWGIYAGFDSGITLISDRSRGLVVLRPIFTPERRGAETPGTGGRAPMLYLFGTAYLGNTRFALEVENGPPSTAGAVVIGNRRTVVIGGLNIHVDLALPHVVLPVTTGAGGMARLNLPVPNTASAAGVSLTGQAFVADANGRLGLAASTGVTFTVFRR